jgi:hypothetical protein
MRGLLRFSRYRLEGSDDQAITDENRDPFAKLRMHTGEASPGHGIVEARHVIVDERGAVQKLNGDGGAVGGIRFAIAAGCSDGEAKTRPYACATWKYRMPQCLRQDRRASIGGRITQGALHASLDALGEIHQAYLQRMRSCKFLTTE